MEYIRSFIAIELPEDIRHQIKLIQDKFKLVDPSSSKWVDPDKIHLTLKFLGNITASQINTINNSVAETLTGKNKFRLILGNPGAFPDKKRVRILWVGVDGDLQPLNVIQQELDTNLEPSGFEAEKRSFRPHLTLARIYDNVSIERRQALGNLCDSIISDNKSSFEVSAIVLFKSELTRSGPMYTKLNSFVL